MHLNFAILLTLLLCNFCLSDSVETANNEEKTTFADLVPDIKYLILRELDFIDVVTMAQMNLELQSIASSLFFVEYRDYTVRLKGDIKSIYHNKSFVDEKSRSIEIREHEFEQSVTKYLGSAIQKLEVDNFNSYKLDRYDNTINFINRYASNSLTYLNLHHITEDHLEKFEQFTKVTNLCLILMSENGNKHIQLSSIFPELQRLDLQLYDRLHFDLLNNHFPHLKHCVFSMFFMGLIEKWDGSQVEGMLSKNPQILSVEIESFPENFVKMIGRYLPNLEKLTIRTYFDVGDEELRLENVKHLELHSNYPKNVDKLSIPHLQSLVIVDIFYEDEDIILDQWYEFFKNHQNLSKLEIYDSPGKSIRGSLLVGLIFRLPNLTELKLVATHYYLDPQIINRIIPTHRKLTKIYLQLQAYQKLDIAMLKQELQNEWHVRDSAEDILWVQLKNSTLLE